MFNIFKDTIGRDLMKIANHFNGRVDSGEVFKDRKALAINRIKNAVLDGEIGGGGVTPEIEAEIENAQWKTESTEQLFNETVTTVAGNGGNQATLSYATQITNDTLKVTFNGVEYICAKSDTNGEYGAPYNIETQSFDFSEYPFNIAYYNDANYLATQTAGTYTVSASVDTVTTTGTFKNEVKKLSNAVQLISGVTSTEEVNNALQDGKLLYFYNSLTDATRPALRIITGHSTTPNRYDFTPADVTIYAVDSDGKFRVIVGTT